MYKLVIADDEAMIRKGLTKSVDWKSLGFDLVAVFEDGSDVIEYIQNNPVDVVFSDILMCNASGLDVAKYIHENQIPTKIILMSGYQEFRYAHEAIRYHVYDYLLKPVSTDEIIDKFSALRNSFDSDPSRVTAMTSQQTDEAKCIFNVQTIFIDKLWNDYKISDLMFSFIHSVAEFGALNTENMVVFMCQCSNSDDSVKNWLITKQEELKENGFYVCCMNPNHLLIMFSCGKEIEENSYIRQALKLLSSEKYHFFFVKKKKVQQSSLCARNFDVSNENIIKILNISVEYLQGLDESRENVPSAINLPLENFDSELIPELLRLAVEIFCLKLSPVKISPQTIDMIFADLVYNKQNIFDYLSEVYNKMVAVQNGRFSNGYDFAIEKIRKYIKDHISEDISVNTLADLVHLNTAYFGRYFKNATFMTVKQYIYETRMELAIELLAQKKYTVVEIAKRVGYDFKYFFPLFKRYTGYTPKEYLKYFIN